MRSILTHFPIWKGQPVLENSKLYRNILEGTRSIICKFKIKFMPSQQTSVIFELHV